VLYRPELLNFLEGGRERDRDGIALNNILWRPNRAPFFSARRTDALRAMQILVGGVDWCVMALKRTVEIFWAGTPRKI
jgi:hypothetical protein